MSKSSWDDVLRAESNRDEVERLRRELRSARAVLGYREQELLELKGPCSRPACHLHYAHKGPCDTAGNPESVEP